MALVSNGMAKWGIIYRGELVGCIIEIIGVLILLLSHVIEYGYMSMSRKTAFDSGVRNIYIIDVVSIFNTIADMAIC